MRIIDFVKEFDNHIGSLSFTKDDIQEFNKNCLLIATDAIHLLYEDNNFFHNNYEYINSIGFTVGYGKSIDEIVKFYVDIDEDMASDFGDWILLIMIKTLGVNKGFNLFYSTMVDSGKLILIGKGEIYRAFWIDLRNNKGLL